MIWQRYLLKELLKVCALVLFSFYFLYAILDYSTHMQDFIKNQHIQLSDIFVYYTFQFFKRAPLLIPLGFLVACIKVLTTLNSSRELIALQASGLSLKRLLKPFFLLAACCTLFSFMNVQFLFPKSVNYLDHFHHAHFRHSHRGKRVDPIHVLYLQDNSKLIYQSYDPTTLSFFDVIWVISADNFWRIKHLKGDPKEPLGTFVDHIERNRKNELEKTESYDSYLFSTLKWQQTHKGGFIPTENRSMSNLYQLLSGKEVSSYERSEILTQLLFKCVIPLLPLFLVIAIAPFCVRYDRNLPTFLIYAAGIFGFIALYTLLNAAVILGENRVISPYYALLTPLVLSTIFFGWKFSKI